MCGVTPKVLIDPAWPDAALDQVGDLLRAVRCPLLGPDQPNVPLAFTRGGEAVTVQWQCGRLVAKPITPALFAIDIVGHVCRPVKLARGWWARAIRSGVMLQQKVDADGTPCGFPASFARAFLASHRVDWLPMLYSHHLAAWQPDAVLLPEWNVFRDRIVEVPLSVSTEVAASVPTAPIPTEMAALVSTEMAALVSTEMAAPEMPVPTAQPAQPADAPQLALPPLPGVHS